MSDLKQMEADLATLQAKVLAERTRVKTEALEAIKDMLASGTLVADDLAGLLPKGASVARIRTKQPKYRDPESGNTWTGQGAEPNWIKGKERDAFLIAP